MASMSDVVKNVFWILVLLSIAPSLIRTIKTQYSDVLESKTKVGVIPIRGLLNNASPIVHDLKEFFEDASIKAIVLKIDSPGGLAGTAQTIYNEINHFKSVYPNKFVVSFVENLAGSGGYYVASASNYIIAAPGAFIGSIGSYIQHPYFKEFIEQYKIKYEVIKSGTYKTAGNPLLELTPEQKAQFQSITDDVYRQFIRDVALNRPQLPADSKQWADGKIFTGEQALKLKLIDAVGSPATVVKTLKENAPIVGKIDWVKPTKRLPFLQAIFARDETDDQSSYIKSAAHFFEHIQELFITQSQQLMT